MHDVYHRDAVVVDVGDVDFTPVRTHAQTVREFAGLDLANDLFLRYVNDEDIVVLGVRHVSQLAWRINNDMRGMTTYLYIRRALDGKRLGVENQKPSALHLVVIV